MSRWLCSALAIAGLAACVGCPSEPEPDSKPTTRRTQPPKPKTPSAAVVGEPTPGIEDFKHQLEQLPVVELTVGGVPVTAYLANNGATRALGMMFVEEFPDDRGMIFVYPSADRHGFWMHNCYIPLSIAYIGENFEIDQVIDMEAGDENSQTSRALVRYVLEVNKGWFRRHKVPREGAKVEGLAELLGYE